MENTGENILIKVKEGQAAAEAAATVSERGQKVSTQYEWGAEADSSKHVLLSVRGNIGGI